MAGDNKLLGQFDLVGIPPAPRGAPQIEVTFDIDANGIVNVSAKDKATGKEQQIRIQASGGLSQVEIERMIKEAEANAEADKKRRALVEARNRADAEIAASQKALEESKDSAPAAEKEAVEKAIEDLKSVAGSDSAADIEAKAQMLQIALLNFKAKLNDSSARGASGPSPTGDDDVVDADFEELDDKDDRRNA
jgi:molecular chaperone DnaK